MAPPRSRGRNLNQVLAERRARRLSRLRTIAVAALIGVALVALLRSVLSRRVDPAYVANRLVVVPFENRTGNAAFDTLGLVTSDWVTRVLGNYAQARQVVPTTTTLAYMHSARLARHDLYNRALALARGTRAQFVVWGTIYQTGDSLHFNLEMQDVNTSLMVGSFPRISVTADNVMWAIDRVRGLVMREVFVGQFFRQRPLAGLDAYQAFVSGLDHYVNRRYAHAAADFARSRDRDTVSSLPHQIWLVDALIGARQFDDADAAARRTRGLRVTRADEARAMRGRAWLRADRAEAYSWASLLATQNAADDLARYEFALEALANAAPRAARRPFTEMQPHTGLLHGRPDFFLHHAAAYHLMNNHQQELRVVRAGLMLRYRSLDVRLANCRARAALGNAENAIVALNAIASNDTDTTSIITVGDALEDCGAELAAHGLGVVAARAEALRRQWQSARPRRPAIVRHSVYERAYIQLEEARALAAQGKDGAALNRLYEARGNGLPYYEPGRMMLHAEPAFRKLLNTRGFLRINQTGG